MKVCGGVDGLRHGNGGVGSRGDIGLDLGGDVSADGHVGGALEGVDERQTGLGGEGERESVLVVELGVVEGLSVAESVGGLLDHCKERDNAR